MYIKNSCKAIIINNSRILLNKCKNEDGIEYYVLPGGGQLCGETMEEAVVRECYEETGCRVRVERPAAFGERVSAGRHKLYHVYMCSLDISEEKTDPINPDVNQNGCEWIELRNKPRFYPAFIRNRFGDILANRGVVYLGSENDGTPLIDRGKITVKYLQEYIRSKDCRPGFEETYFIKLIEETGELARLMIRGEPKTNDNDVSDNFKGTIREELWDIMYYVIALANLYNIDFERIISLKEAYNNSRYHPGLKFDPEEWSLLQ